MGQQSTVNSNWSTVPAASRQQRAGEQRKAKRTRTAHSGVAVCGRRSRCVDVCYLAPGMLEFRSVSLSCWYGVAGTAPSWLTGKVMRLNLRYVVVAILRIGVAQASNFESALDLIMRYHGKDSKGLSNTLDALTQIATKLRDEPKDPRYRSIRILNKTFWERVGSVNGGISFMSALGFDLVEQGA